MQKLKAGRYIFLKIIILCSGFPFSASAQGDTLAPAPSQASFSAKDFISPALITGFGLSLSGQPRITLQEWRDRNVGNFRTRVDDVLCLAPIAVVYGLDLAGVKARTDFMNRSAILLKSELMAVGTVYLLKAATLERRPDGSDLHSFPSSHSAQAFLAATFLSIEYGQRYKWMPYAAYTVASSVAALRVLNNKHYINDVLVGAGIGILAQKLSYLTHQYHWAGKRQKAPLDF